MLFEQYWQKWEILRKENAEILRKVNLALEQIVTTSAGAGAGPGGSGTGSRGSNNDSIINFNPSVDTKPSFLKKKLQC